MCAVLYDVFWVPEKEDDGVGDDDDDDDVRNRDRMGARSSLIFLQLKAQG